MVGRNMSLKNPVTPPGIDPGTVRLVAQRLNHYATPEEERERKKGRNFSIGYLRTCSKAMPGKKCNIMNNYCKL